METVDLESAERWLRRLVDHHQGSGDALQLAKTLANLGVALTSLGRLDEAADACRQAAEVAAGAASPGQESTALSNLAHIHIQRGQWPQAEASAQRAHDLALRLADPAGVGYSLSNLALARFELGQPRAERDFEEVFAIADEISDPYLAVSTRRLRADALRRRGRTGAARQQFAEIVQLTDPHSFQQQADEARAALAELDAD